MITLISSPNEDIQAFSNFFSKNHNKNYPSNSTGIQKVKETMIDSLKYGV